MNYNLQLLQHLYSSASGKYLKFKSRYEKAIQNGRFYKLNKRKQSILVSRLKKLYERLRSLHTQLRLAGAGLALTLAISSTTLAQGTLGPFVRNDAANPFPPPVNFEEPRPVIVDIDNDGDLDIFVGNLDGSIRFFQNDSPTGSVTRFTEVTGSANPLISVNKGYHASPDFADVDGDGDFDMLLGVGSGYTYFFRNTGSPTNPAFTEQTGVNNPFDGITGTSSKYGINRAIPVFVNLDGDSDVDLFIGSSYEYDIYGAHPAVQYFENNAGGFTIQESFLASELGNLYNVKLAFVDIDGDLDLDAFVGSDNNYIRTFRQDSELTFTRVYAGANPFQNIYFSNFTSPAVADIDGDSDFDVLIGNGDYGNPYFGPDRSNIRYFENGGSFLLQDRTDLNISPFGGIDVGQEAAPVFVDLDGDGDLDAVIGSKYSFPDDIFVYINDNGKFVADPDHDIVDLVADINGSRQDIIPVFVDIDNDSDQDMFICRSYDINFFRNNAGTFVEETSPLDPGTVREISIAFIDTDNDNDFDVFVSNDYSVTLLYFENTGTPTNPNFVSAAPPAPFVSTEFENTTNISAIDLDNDGDTDLLTTETYYNGWYGDSDAARTRFFENIGDGTFSESQNPLIIELTPNSFTSFVDMDGDSDLDAFVGGGYSFDYAQNGRVFLFENTNPPPVTNVISTTLEVSGGVATILDPFLTISDSDNDDIVSAVVTISDFLPGEEVLDFTLQAGIEGVFDATEGVLTFIGRATIAEYQVLLRSVTFNFTGDVPGGRKSKAGRVSDLAQDITFQVRDTDFTLTTVSVVSLNIVSGSGEIQIFNAISPGNEDELNAFFNIRNIETVSPENKVTIYNRWGDVVYEVSDYNNTTTRFEGINNNGKELPSGTYFYKIEIIGQTLTGYLSLRR